MTRSWPSWRRSGGGELEDWELDGARSTLLNAYASMGDSQGKLENFYLGQAATGQEDTPELLAEQVRQVTPGADLRGHGDRLPGHGVFPEGKGGGGMKQTFYERIGESVLRETLPNGLQICVVPKPEFARSYAFFATRYGGMDTRLLPERQVAGHPGGHRPLPGAQDVRHQGGNALQELAKNGAEPNAFTSNAMTGYYFDSTEHFEENLAILLSFVSIPYFTEESVAKEQGIIGQEIRMIEDNPDWQLYTRMMKALYKNSTARTSIAGTVESISTSRRRRCTTATRPSTPPPTLILTVVGNVDPVHVADLAKRILPREGGPVIPRDYGQEPPEVARRETRMAMEVAARSSWPPTSATRRRTGRTTSAPRCWAPWPATSCWGTPALCTSASMRRG